MTSIVNFVKSKLTLFSFFVVLAWLFSMGFLYPELFLVSSRIAIGALALVTLIALLTRQVSIATLGTVFIATIALLFLYDKTTMAPLWIGLIAFGSFFTLDILSKLEQKYEVHPIELLESVIFGFVYSQIIILSLNWTLSIMSIALVLTYVYFVFRDILDHRISVPRSLVNVIFGIVILGIIIWLNYYR